MVWGKPQIILRHPEQEDHNCLDICDHQKHHPRGGVLPPLLSPALGCGEHPPYGRNRAP